MHSLALTSRKARRPVWVAAALVTTLLLSPASALAETWGMGSFQNRGVDDAAVATFQDLLRDEIGTRLGVSVIDVPGACDDIECVRAAAKGTGTQYVVHGSVGRLGSKVVVSVNVVDVQSGASRFSQRMNSNGVEELDVVAARMATAMAADKPVDKTAELGNITQGEAKKPRRRQGRFAGTFAMQGIVPLSGYADQVGGGGIELGMWFETYDIAIEPKFGVRFDMGDPARDYVHLPIEIGVSWLASRSDISPVLGVGAGMNFVWESVERRSRVGSVLVQEVENGYDDFASLFAVFARAGVLLMRTYNGSVLISVDLAHGFGRFDNRRENGETAVRFNLQLIFGGG